VVTGAYTLDGDLTAIARAQVDAGKLVSPNFRLLVEAL